MALFSQDDSDEDETPSMGAAFSGREEPDEETETPSPAEVDNAPETPEVAQPDDANANAYAQSPEDQEPQGEAALADQFTPSEGEEGSSAGGYSEPAAPAAGGMTLPAGPVYGDWSADRAALENQYAKEAQQNVKPSIGRRILAGLAGAATTFGGGNGNQVTQTVLNRPAAQAQAGWTRQEAPLKQQLANDAAQDAQTQRTYQGQRQAVNDQALNEQRQEHAQEFRAQADQRAQDAADKAKAPVGFAPDDKNNPYAGGTVTLANGQTVKGPPPDKWLTAWERDPANKAKAQANAGVQTMQALEAAGVKLTPEQRAIVASGGKITPSVRTTISVRENPDGTPITPKTQQMTQAQRDVILQAKQQGMTHAHDQLAASVYTPQQAQTQMQAVQDTYEQKIGVDPSGPDHLSINPDFSWSKSGQKVAGAAQSAPQRTMAVPNPPGLVEPGNLPIDNRPTVQNADGSHSSEYSVSFQDDKGREVLLPTIVNGKFLTPDGTKPPEGSPQEKAMFQAAWQNYQKTGQHLGKFKDAATANNYANQLHNRGSAEGGEQAASPAQAAPAPQQQPQSMKVSSGQTVKIGDPITLNGKTGTVAGFNAQGKVIPKWN
jgi:hypothetical protein